MGSHDIYARPEANIIHGQWVSQHSLSLFDNSVVQTVSPTHSVQLTDH